MMKTIIMALALLLAGTSAALAACNDPPGLKVDWHGCSFVRHNLHSANLRDANLKGADLRGADLEEADLQGAELLNADLTGAELRGAILYHTILVNAYLIGADLRFANLKGADLEYAHLGANLDAGLRDTDLLGAEFTGARWVDGHICKARQSYNDPPCP